MVFSSVLKNVKLNGLCHLLKLYSKLGWTPFETTDLTRTLLNTFSISPLVLNRVLILGWWLGSIFRGLFQP